ncbi:MAG: glucoamylase family protein, partial [Saprospiraceae bacterium]
EWSGYNEAMVLLIMAMGSPTHPIASDAWAKWCSHYQRDSFYGYQNVQFDPLFGHQYSHIWIDFKGIRDSYMESLGDDYFENSVNASLSNRAYCISNPGKWSGYSDKLWGLTACDGPYHGKKVIDGIERKFFDYRARGASSIQIIDDGTIAPTAAGGSFPFIPIESESSLKHMWDTYYDQLVGPFGFKDAFNLTYRDTLHPNGWFDIDYLGIDQGPILLQIQNHETGILWKTMKKNPYIVAGLKKAGFRGGWLNDH